MLFPIILILILTASLALFLSCPNRWMHWDEWQDHIRKHQEQIR